MTRKQAIRRVLEHLQSIPEPDETLCTATLKLQEMLNGIPGKIWDDKTIRAAIERFIRENGRPPKVKELDAVEYLPPHPSIVRQYRMTAGTWLNQNYPREDYVNWRFRYAGYTLEDFKAIFIQEYNRIRPDNCLSYNRGRTPGTPSWQYTAKRLNVRTWSELKALCGTWLLPKKRKGEFDLCAKSHVKDFDY